MDKHKDDARRNAADTEKRWLTQQNRFVGKLWLRDGRDQSLQLHGAGNFGLTAIQTQVFGLVVTDPGRAES